MSGKSARRKRQQENHQHIRATIVHEGAHLVLAYLLDIQIIQFTLYKEGAGFAGLARTGVDPGFAPVLESARLGMLEYGQIPQHQRIMAGKLCLFWIAGPMGEAVFLGERYEPAQNLFHQDDWSNWRMAIPILIGSDDLGSIIDAEQEMEKVVADLLCRDPVALTVSRFMDLAKSSGAHIEGEAVQLFFENHLGSIKPSLVEGLERVIHRLQLKH